MDKAPPDAGVEKTGRRRAAGRPRRRRGSFGVLGFLFTGLVAVAGLTAAGGGYVMHRFDAPGPLATDSLVQIPRGSSLDQITGRLTEAGVLSAKGAVSDAMMFTLMARFGGRAGAIKAGEYVFPAGVSGRTALDMMVAGQVFVRKVTIAEGLTTAEALLLVAAADGLAGPPTLTPGEGTLLPETYHFQRGDRADALVRRMQDAMDDTLARLWPARDPSIPLKTPREAVILASIVEKETGVADERPTVASVFYNRLKRGMRLQSDPTVVYAATGGSGPLGRPIRRSDLNRDNPYNTYKVRGLPPGPIANPGLESLQAVLNPVQSPYLYFVADGTGGHVFARTLAEHNRNVQRWRRIERQRQQAQ